MNEDPSWRIRRAHRWEKTQSKIINKNKDKLKENAISHPSKSQEHLYMQGEDKIISEWSLQHPQLLWVFIRNKHIFKLKQ